MKRICRIWLIGLLAVLTAGGRVAAEQAEAMICLSGLCVSDHVTKKIVVKKLGPGVSANRPEDTGLSLCYFDTKAGVWADFTFTEKEMPSGKESLGGIMLTEQKLCDDQGRQRKVVLGRALAGAVIGMDQPAVIEALGRPTRIDDAKARETGKPSMADTRYSAKFGDQVYVYDKADDLGFKFIYFRSGKVRSIWYSNSE